MYVKIFTIIFVILIIAIGYGAKQRRENSELVSRLEENKRAFELELTELESAITRERQSVAKLTEYNREASARIDDLRKQQQREAEINRRSQELAGRESGIIAELESLCGPDAVREK